MDAVKKTFIVLYEDTDLVAIDKPQGFHVHPPENFAEKVPAHKVVLSMLRRQVGVYLYPVHRLDVATSGVLVFAKSSEMARELQLSWQSQETQKTYEALIRGFPKQDRWINTLDLKSDSSGEMVPAITHFETLKQIELPFAAGKKFSTSRLSWIQAMPQTGRYHQIRRHLNRESLPIIGDTDHGDSHYNRFVREKLKIPGLCLRAFHLSLIHPSTKERIKISAPRNHKWRQIEKLMMNTELYLASVLK